MGVRRPAALGLIPLLCVMACGGGGGAAPPFVFEQVFDFQVVRADAPTLREFPVINPFPRPAVVELVGTAAPAIAPLAGALPSPVASLGTFQLPVVLVPGPPGSMGGEFTIRFRVEASGERREIRLRFLAEVEPAFLRLLTPSVDFGNVRIGEKRSRPFSIRNDSAQTPVLVLDISALPAPFRRTGPPLPLQVPAGATLSFTIEYEPTVLESHHLPIAVSHEAGPDLAGSVRAVADTWVERIVVDFGDVPVAGGESPWLEVALPAHAVSLSLEGVGPPGIVLATNGFEGPGGKVYENATFTGAFLQSADSEVFTATLPESDDPAVQLVPGGGTYRFRLKVIAGSATSLAARAIILNRPLGIPLSGHLDLNIFLSTGLGITAATAPSDPTLQAVLAEADRILAQRELRLGSVDYYALPSGYEFIQTEARFGDLCEESAAAVRNRLNLFLVREAIGGDVLGIAARIAGPMRAGTRASGVMVDYDSGSIAARGYVIAHELGHYLGLWHTTESDGSHDLISDTAECPASGTNAACPTPGGSYLMHWQVLAANPVITAAQGRILLVHPHVDEGGSGLARAVAPPAPPADPSELPPGWCGCKGCNR